MPTFPEPTEPLRFDDVMNSLPPIYPDDTLLAQIHAEIVRSRRKVVVLDDDPTGPQARGDAFVLTEWSIAALRRELSEPRPLFFVLTNTRALPTAQAVAAQREVADNLREAARQCGVAYDIMVRGDSTLRGHYPDEMDALGESDGTILVPFFEEGNRYTFDDAQWVKEADWLVPAAQTPYARDHTFGYHHSNLRNWVEEKSRGRIRAADVISISLDIVRRGGPAAVTATLMLSRRHTAIVNAMHYRDLEVFALGLLRAEAQGKRFAVRCAASFVRVRAGSPSPHPLSQTGRGARGEGTRGGLIIVGSHVPKSSMQLQRLLQEGNVVSTELRVQSIINGDVSEVVRVSTWMNGAMADGRHAVIYTSREVEPRGRAEGLVVGQKISSAFVTIVRSLKWRPRFIIAKGGWTASEIGKQTLGVKRAYAPAPILPGVPLWILGEETRWPALPFVIFPGNVGAEDALVQVVRTLQT